MKPVVFKEAQSLSSKYKVQSAKSSFRKTPHLCFFDITCVACQPFLAGFPITGNEIQFLSSDGRRLREFVLVREGSLPNILTRPDGIETRHKILEVIISES